MMGLQPLSPALPREVAPELRSFAETVWRLLARDGLHAALRMVSRAIRDLEDVAVISDPSQGWEARLQAGVSRRAYLLNLRGIVQAQQRDDDAAMADLLDATLEAPTWFVPWYNLGLFHKGARRWQQAHDALQRALSCCRGRNQDPSRPLLWNLGIAQTALSHFSEARATWKLCGLPIQPGPAQSPPDMDLGLAQLSLPTKGTYAAERVWVQRLDPTRARILSVVRYGAPCQFGDVVLCDSGEGHTGYWDGLAMGSEPGDAAGTLRSREPGTGGMVFLDVLETAGYVLHVVRGAPAAPAQATALTERLREADLHIEVWSLTMRLPDETRSNQAEGGATPLCAGLVIPYNWQDPRRSAERAAQELHAVAQELSLPLYAPTLLEAAGDEIGAARHRKGLRLQKW